MKGIYVLVLRVNKDISLNVGKLNKIDFKRGLYAYIGSAQNSLELRISRHLRRNKKKHWHIDYLTTNKDVDIIKVFYSPLSKEYETKIASLLLNKFPYIPKFGSTDSKAKSHLFFIDSYESLVNFLKQYNFKEFLF